MRRPVMAKLLRFGLPGSVRTLQDVLSRVEATTGRPIEVVSVNFRDRRVTAAWKHDEAARRDFIFVEARLSAYQRVAAILHEIGHLVAGHTGSQSVEWPFLRADDTSSLVAAGVAKRMMLRSDHDGPEEREAERIADVLLGVLTSRASGANEFDDAFTP